MSVGVPPAEDQLGRCHAHTARMRPSTFVVAGIVHDAAARGARGSPRCRVCACRRLTQPTTWSCAHCGRLPSQSARSRTRSYSSIVGSGQCRSITVAMSRLLRSSVPRRRASQPDEEEFPGGRAPSMTTRLACRSALGWGWHPGRLTARAVGFHSWRSVSTGTPSAWARLRTVVKLGLPPPRSSRVREALGDRRVCWWRRGRCVA
jgi:hypothetical protein